MGHLHDIVCGIGWDGLTALGTVALALISIFALLYAKQQLNDFRKESKIKHLIDLVDQFEREPLAAYRSRLGAKRAPKGKLQPLDPDDPPPELHDLLNFFEHMGYLLEGRYLELEDISVEFHYWIFHIWADAREVIKSEQLDEPIYYEYFERMVVRLGDREHKRMGKFELPSKSEIEDFYTEEAHLPSGSPIPRQRRLKHRQG
jgi:hypothetical protein